MLHSHSPLPKEPFHLKQSVVETVRTLPTTIIYMAAATLVSSLMFHFTDNLINVSIVYILAIILHARATSCYGAGIIASLYSVFWVNYAFSVPYMKLNFTLSGYPLTFFGMAFISCFTSSICIMISRQTNLIREQDKKLMNAEKETMRANLLRAVSHDLRTPLTSIIGYLELLSGKVELPREMEKKYIDIAYAKSRRLEKLIEDLFGFTKLNYGKLSMNVGKVDIVKLLEQLLEEFYPNFAEKNLSYELHSNLPSKVIDADGNLLARLFDNLINNAIKYGADGKRVLVQIQAEEEIVTVSVTNYGYVIPENELPLIFNKFYRVEQSRSTHTGGTGLGLAIAKSVAEMHGGSIQVKSDLDGTVFTVKLKTHFDINREQFEVAE